MNKIALLILILLTWFSTPAIAGPYAPTVGHTDFAAVHMDDVDFIGWATGYRDLVYGTDVDDSWKTPDKALGKAYGDSYDIVCLGRGGRITMTFDDTIRNRAGWDFAVFENSFNDTFLELAYVEVSSDGTHFTRFPNRSLTESPVAAFGSVDPSNIMGLASKYQQGYGTPFDLQDLLNNTEVINGLVDVNAINYIRLVDIVGDGTYYDSTGHVIYDPYPTVLSSGFDLDAVGVKYLGTYANTLPAAAVPFEPTNGELNVSVNTTLKTDAFNDPDVNGDDGDFHSLTRWQVATDSGFADVVADFSSHVDLTSWQPAGGILIAGQTYYWRAKHFDFNYRVDGSNDADYTWSGVYSFSTIDPNDPDGDGVPDALELTDGSVDLDGNGVPDATQVATDTSFKALNSATGQGPLAVKAPAGTTVDTLGSVDPASAPELKIDESNLDQFFAGVTSFRLTVPSPGDQVTVTVYLPSTAPDGYDYYKYRSDTGWQKYAYAVISADRLSVQLTLKDGSFGDADGLANGIIVDPGGLAVAAGDSGTAPVDGAAGIGGGGGGGGGCFLETVLTNGDW